VDTLKPWYDEQFGPEPSWPTATRPCTSSRRRPSCTRSSSWSVWTPCPRRPSHHGDRKEHPRGLPAAERLHRRGRYSSYAKQFKLLEHHTQVRRPSAATRCQGRA
jgi:hypothetical protein